MVKQISQITLVMLFGLGIATFCHLDFANAAGIYKLEYPQGYGCCCPPNVNNFGYFHTGWRVWPGEVRLDKSFPRAIGMEKLPTPEGQEIIPVPRTQQHIVPETTPSQPELEGGVPLLPEGLPKEEIPTEKPTEPGQETPALPGLPPTEQGEFNPLPGLPPDLNVLPPLKANEKEEKKSPSESKPESGSKGETEEKSKDDATSPNSNPKSEDGSDVKSPVHGARLSRLEPVRQSLQTSNPKADWESALQPDTYDKSVHSATSYSDHSVAQAATHLAPLEAAKPAGRTRDIAAQLNQQPYDSRGASGVVQSEYKDDVPRVALDGFCPVELIHSGTWVQGDPHWTVVYKGLIYRLSGNSQRQEFLANPEKFIPANNGFDPVLSTFEKRNIPGLVNFCASYKGRIYMFSSTATQEEFYKYPDLYSGKEVK